MLNLCKQFVYISYTTKYKSTFYSKNWNADLKYNKVYVTFYLF